ncbi:MULTISPECIES: ScbR family autoregulator-binding transcription factor [unclassified Streptomyces]|uniref:ScbR family autoregulator-binding transcription factor n=1 Tax=unclassified Streptomyces TaxID=2593676 RepID=UPI0033A90233
MAKRAVKQERAIQTREALIQAGAEVFGEFGFAGASVSKIADRAGLTLGAMYFHFKSKEDLAREIVLAQPGRVTPPHESEGLQRAVDITLTWAYGLADDAVLYAGARLVMEQDHFVAPEGNSHQQWAALLASDFRTAQARREMRGTADTEALARLVVNACTGAQMHSSIESGRADLPRRIEEMWRIVLPSVTMPSAFARLEFGPERGVRG